MSSLSKISIKNHGCYYHDGMKNIILVFKRPSEKYIFIYCIARKTTYDEFSY